MVFLVMFHVFCGLHVGVSLKWMGGNKCACFSFSKCMPKCMCQHLGKDYFLDCLTIGDAHRHFIWFTVRLSVLIPVEMFNLKHMKCLGQGLIKVQRALRTDRKSVV